MYGPTDELRYAIGARMSEVESEEELDQVLARIERELEADLVEVRDDPDTLAAIDSWASLASYALGRFYAPASPWPRNVAGWGTKAIKRLHGIVKLLSGGLTTAAKALGASSWSIGVGFPWGISISLTWP